MQHSIVDCRYKFNIFIRRLIFYGIYIYILKWNGTSRPLEMISLHNRIYMYTDITDF